MRRLFASPWWHDFKLLQKESLFRSAFRIPSLRFLHSSGTHKDPPASWNEEHELLNLQTWLRLSGCGTSSLQRLKNINRWFDSWKILIKKKPTALSPQANFASHSVILYWRYPHSAKGPWNKSLNFIFPIRYVIPKSLKVGHWLSEYQKQDHYLDCIFDRRIEMALQQSLQWFLTPATFCKQAASLVLSGTFGQLMCGHRKEVTTSGQKLAIA